MNGNIIFFKRKKAILVHIKYKNVQKKRIYLPEYLLNLGNIHSFAEVKKIN